MGIAYPIPHSTHRCLQIGSSGIPGPVRVGYMNPSDILRALFGHPSVLRRTCVGDPSGTLRYFPKRYRRNPGETPDHPWTFHGLAMDFPWTWHGLAMYVYAGTPHPRRSSVKSVAKKGMSRGNTPALRYFAGQ
jgi:hypothetical protein